MPHQIFLMIVIYYFLASVVEIQNLFIGSPLAQDVMRSLLPFCNTYILQYNNMGCLVISLLVSINRLQPDTAKL